jgi:hypothetical protein
VETACLGPEEFQSVLRLRERDRLLDTKVARLDDPQMGALCERIKEHQPAERASGTYPPPRGRPAARP